MPTIAVGLSRNDKQQSQLCRLKHEEEEIAPLLGNENSSHSKPIYSYRIFIALAVAIALFGCSTFIIAPVISSSFSSSSTTSKKSPRLGDAFGELKYFLSCPVFSFLAKWSIRATTKWFFFRYFSSLVYALETSGCRSLWQHTYISSHNWYWYFYLLFVTHTKWTRTHRYALQWHHRVYKVWQCMHKYVFWIWRKIVQSPFGSIQWRVFQSQCH